MTAPEEVRAATREAYIDREGLGTSEAFDAAADAAHAATLRAAYWKLREHASGYRSSGGVRKVYERWENTGRKDPELGRMVTVHEWFARGIEAAARDIAELLGVPEHEIDEAARASQPTTAPR